MSQVIDLGRVIGPEGPQGLPGERGAEGPAGPRGDPGQGLSVLGIYHTYAELVTEHPTGSPGDVYAVGGDLYLWDPDGEEWVFFSAIGSGSYPSINGVSPGPTGYEIDANNIPINSGYSVQDGLDDKAELVHTHGAGDIASGTVPVIRGGTGGGTPEQGVYYLLVRSIANIDNIETTSVGSVNPTVTGTWPNNSPAYALVSTLSNCQLNGQNGGYRYQHMFFPNSYARFWRMRWDNNPWGAWVYERDMQAGSLTVSATANAHTTTGAINFPRPFKEQPVGFAIVPTDLPRNRQAAMLNITLTQFQISYYSDATWTMPIYWFAVT